jgi:hypothetical protein
MDKPVQVNITGATQRELAASFDAFTAAGGKLGVVPIQAARRYIAQVRKLQGWPNSSKVAQYFD